MFSWLEEKVRNIVYRERSSSMKYIEFLRKKGVKIGDTTYFYSPRTTEIDLTRPWLVSIGQDVQFARGVVLLTHGYDWSVLRGKYGDILGSAGKVTIGDNVFIGANTTILKGSRIGDNVIVGANSLVHGTLESDTVYAGNPVKKISTIEDYYRKRMNCQLQEAKEVVTEYVNTYNKLPSLRVLYEFFWLFEKRDPSNPGYTDPFFQKMMSRKRTRNLQWKRYQETSPQFENYQAFLKYCGYNLE